MKRLRLIEYVDQNIRAHSKLAFENISKASHHGLSEPVITTDRVFEAIGELQRAIANFEEVLIYLDFVEQLKEFGAYSVEPKLRPPTSEEIRAVVDKNKKQFDSNFPPRSS